ncbi:MAG TPA: AbrB family transcriptional regulator [Stellaceae bacterium]|nr:AbrB family transcriptional regulator [Stellaceae bacterium]
MPSSLLQYWSQHLRPAHPWRWVILLVVSMAMDWLLTSFKVPAALLLGPMLTGVAFGVGGAGLKSSRFGVVCAQAVIGCLIARSLSPSILMSVANDWFEISIAVGTSIIASAFVGWLITKLGILPGTTAAWGSTPGAAAAMVAMSEAYGADIRLVAFMQYVRVLVVVLSASAVSRILLGISDAPIPSSLAAATPHPHLLSLIETLGIAFVGAYLGWKLRIPSGPLLAPMLIGATIQGFGLVDLTLPAWLLALSYTGLGWYIGLGFNREVLIRAFKALPQLLMATLLIILLCALTAWMLVAMIHTDPLTAYLATTPGGLDTVTIIAVGSHSNTPLVLAVQTLRVFGVVLTGPSIARWISRHAEPTWRRASPSKN